MKAEVFWPCRLLLAGSPSCLADYFSWPQVALTHHVCHCCLYAAQGRLSSLNRPATGRGLNSLAGLAARAKIGRAPALSNASNTRAASDARLALAVVDAPASIIASAEIA